MKILIINSRFFLSAGPEKYMFGLMSILEKKGHETIPFSIKNIKNKKSKFGDYFAEAIGGSDKVYFEDYNKLSPKTLYEMVERQFYSFHVKKRLKKLILKTKPDVAYILHHYNKLSPSIIDACKECGLPIVLRLSDFFFACPEGHLLRNGLPCESCLDQSLFSAIKYKCVKNSYLASFIKVCAMKMHRVMRLYEKVDLIVSPSSFTMTKMKKVLKGRMVHIPTFIMLNQKKKTSVGNYALFVGRVEPEKGLMWAIKALQNTSYRLKIVGNSHSGYDAILKDYVEKNKINNIEFVGPLFGKDLAMIYSKARFVMLPVVWYENMPNVALEAMGYGKPILTSDLGSMPEIVKNNFNGLLVKPNDTKALKNAAIRLFEDDAICRRMGKNAFAIASSKYSPEKHYDNLISLFNDLVKRNEGNKRGFS